MKLVMILLAAGSLVTMERLSFSHQEPISLASKHVHDIGIAQDSEVLYTEHFDKDTSTIFRRYTDTKNGAGMWLDSSDIPQGSVTPALVITNDGTKNDGGHLYKLFNPGFNGTIYLRYYVQYPLSSKGYIHHESVWLGGYQPGTSYPNPRAGICGLGSERVSIAYEPVNAPAMDTYLYWGDMRAGANKRCYGNDMINGSTAAQQLQWNKWICVELMIKLNQPASAYNGELAVWHDGKKIGHWGPGFPNGYWNADSWINDSTHAPFKGFRWRTDDKLNINWLWIEFYDDQTPAGQSHHIKFANLVMAKKYIGPINER